MTKYSFAFLLALFTIQFSIAQEHIIPLWETVPNQKRSNEKEVQQQNDILLVSNVQDPLMEVFLPNGRAQTGEAVLIFPGGGYHVLAYDWEGRDLAKYLSSHGIVGIVVKYRLPISKSIINPSIAPLQDAQRAMRIVRSKAKEWHIDENKIGIMGFSAGGHLASTLGTQYDEKVYEPTDDADKLSARPDFMALIYPVITMTDLTHGGSKEALIGKNPTAEMVKKYSGELNVNADTPSTFIVHSMDDDAVPVENSLQLLDALAKNKIYTEAHIYPTGGHGYSMGIGNAQLSSWPGLFVTWVKTLP